MDDKVELLRQGSLKIMAPAFALGPINDADRAFQAHPPQSPREFAIAVEIEPELWQARFMKQMFITVPDPGLFQDISIFWP